MGNPRGNAMNTIEESVKKTLLMEGQSILEIMEALDCAAVEQLVGLLVNCRGRVYVAGCGTSGAAAKKIVHTLNCVERSAAYLNPADAVHGGLGMVQQEDIVILISKGGNTPELTKLVPGCKQKGASVVAVTENCDSELAQGSDILLKIRVAREPDRFNMLATSSTLAVIAVFDSIAICVMDRNGFTKEKFSVIHPGGAVGERLLSGKE